MQVFQILKFYYTFYYIQLCLIFCRILSKNFLTYLNIKYSIYLSLFFIEGKCPFYKTKEKIMNKSLNKRIRFWLDPDTSLLNVMLIEEFEDHKSCIITPKILDNSEDVEEKDSKNCIIVPRVLDSPEEVFSFMFPYLYELAYVEANGIPKDKQLYQEAVAFKNSVEAWLKNQVAWGYMNQTEARIVLSGLYLPTTKFSSP